MPKQVELETSINSSKLPFLFMDSGCTEAWASWYGSMGGVLDLRKEIIDTGIRLEGYSRSELKNLAAGSLLSTLLLGHSYRGELEKYLGVERANELHLQSSLSCKAQELIGKQVFSDIQNQVVSLASYELAELTKSGMPRLHEALEVGGFSHEAITAGLMLRALLESDASSDVLFEDFSHPTHEDFHITYIFDMTAHLYLQMIPVENVRETIISENPRLRRIYTEQGGTDSPLYRSIRTLGSDENIARQCVDVSVQTLKRREIHLDDPLDAMLETVQSFAFATSPSSNFIRRAIESVVSDANASWGVLCEALRILGPEPELLIGANLDITSELIPSSCKREESLRVVDSARTFRSLSQIILARQPNLDYANEICNQINELKNELSGIAVGADCNFERIGELSAAGIGLSRQKDLLVTDLLKSASAVKMLSVDFSRVLFSSDNTQATHSLGDESAEVELISRSDLEVELLDANTKLEAELKLSNSELFKVTSAYDALKAHFDNPVTAVDSVFMDLSKRRAQGKRLNPEDTLRYFCLMVPDRIEILESAWKSAHGSANFAYPERLFEHLCKLVFDYLDHVRSGTPMGRAGRDIFANAFAAKESQTVSQDHSMRAQREFNYNGELRYFEYRLRVGNGWGAVEGMRLYFDVIADKVVVAYVGAHLDQPSTN